MGFLLGGGKYVVAGLVFVLALAFAGYQGWHQRDRLAAAEIGAIKAQAEKNVAEAKEQAAKVTEKVVIQYRDKIVRIREIPPEVAHEVQIIRDSGCRLPAEFLRLHNDAAGSEDSAAIGADDSASCAAAIETIRENYARSRENAAQLEALQGWAKGVSQ